MASKEPTKKKPAGVKQQRRASSPPSVTRKQPVRYTVTDWRNMVKNGGDRKVMGRIDDRTKVAYLNHLAMTGRIGESCRVANISQEAMRYLRIHDPDFGQLHEEALETYRDTIETEIHVRAIEGRERPVYQNGELVGYVVERSDRMLELLAKRHIPAYTDNVNLNTKHSGGVMVIPQGSSSDQEWEEQEGHKARHETVAGGLPQPGVEP